MLPALLLAALAASTAPRATGEPRVPAGDNEVVAVLPACVPVLTGAAACNAATRNPSQAPLTAEEAIPLARAYVMRARRDGDPRFLGRAEALLERWRDPATAPVEALVLRATIDQSRHRFDAALATLDVVLARDPRDSQALLTRATVMQVLARYSEAARDCRRLAAVADARVAVTCSASVASLTGRGPAAYLLLDQALDSPGDDGSAPIDPALATWSRTVLGEIAERNGDATAAERHFRAALALDPGDRYLRAVYADLMLASGRPDEARRLTVDYPDDDGLLLRYTIALKTLAAPGWQRNAETLAERHAAARLRGDALHRREEARLALDVLDRPADALRLADSNWRVQKEPADARILLRAAQAAGDRATAEHAQAWLAGHGIAVEPGGVRARLVAADTQPDGRR